MGSWGAGLYADDFALDLRGDIAGIFRLPMAGDEILALLRAGAGGLAENPSDDEYTRFWLVLADQFQKRGIECAEVTRRAIDIIESGADIKTLVALGMTKSALRKRATMLNELRARLESGPAASKRKVLKTPQKLIMRPGGLFAYPTSGGQPYNPYVPPEMQEQYDSLYQWKQDGWGALLILKAQLAHGYLAWYFPLVVRKQMTEKPTLASLQNEQWTTGEPGTCSATHFKRMGMESIGEIAIRPDAVEQFACSDEYGAQAALLEASLANYMEVQSDNPNQGKHLQRLWTAKPVLLLPQITTS